MIDLDLKTRAQIVKSVVAAVRVSPDKLTKKAYQWLMQRGGFIARFDHAGFIANYATRESLREALLVSAESCHSIDINTGPRDKYHRLRLWNAHTMLAILKALDIRPHGRIPVVTPVEFSEEDVALLSIPEGC